MRKHLRKGRGILLVLFACSIAGPAVCAEEPVPKPKAWPEILEGFWEGETEKGKFELVFDKRGNFTTGKFLGFTLQDFKFKSLSPVAFEVKYAIEAMKGMTVTIQFKDGQFDAGCTTLAGSFNTMLAKGKITFQKSGIKTVAEKKDAPKAGK